MSVVRELPHFLRWREFESAAHVVLIERKGASP